MGALIADLVHRYGGRVLVLAAVVLIVAAVVGVRGLVVGVRAGVPVVGAGGVSRVGVRPVRQGGRVVTTVGELRARYAAEVEPRPSRFFEPELYREWSARADAWAEAQL